MKMKLLLLLGLIVGSLGVSALFSSSAFAAGETYRWENSDTIVGSGGSYNNQVQKNIGSGQTTRAVPVETVTFTREGTSAVFKAPTTGIFDVVAANPTAGGSQTCTLQLTITVSTTNTATGSLRINDPGQTTCSGTELSTTTAITGTGPDPASFSAVAEGDAEEEAVSTCQVDGIGWIICPVMNFIGEITDNAYIAVQSLLTTQPLTFNAEANPTRDAWTIMRNFANIVFVIFFLFVIFSQLTSFGISNYGIKKILPRLIVVAILVNVSYILCALAVDISNILGSSLKELLDGITTNYKQSLNEEQAGGIFNGDNIFTNIIGAVLAGGTVVGVSTMLGLSVLLPIAITALVAIVTVVAVLTLRQALIIILIVISPLAFVAFLLPNTEDWFKKWRKLFATLLLMYPIIALIFGASAFAGAVIMNSAQGSTPINTILIQIMGAGVTIIPLFITPVVMRTAGTFLNRFGGGINNPNKGPFDRMRKGAEGVRKRQEGRRAIRALNGGKVIGAGRFKRQAQRSRIESGIESEKKRAETVHLADKTVNDEKFRNKAAGGLNYGGPDAPAAAVERALNSAIDVQNQIDVAEVKAASAMIEHMNFDSSQVKELAKGGDVIKDGQTFSGSDDALRKAAIGSGVSTGTVGDVEDIIRSAGSMTDDQRKTLSSAVASSGIANKATHLGGQTIDDIAQGKVTNDADLDRVTARAIEGGKYSAEKLADNDKDSLKRISSVINQPNSGISAARVADLHGAANEVVSDARISGRVTKAQQPFMDQLVTITPISTGAPQAGNPTASPVQNQPGTLNISHTPSGATPANSRTSVPPNTSGYKPTSNDPNGLSLPPDFKR